LPVDKKIEEERDLDHAAKPGLDVRVRDLACSNDEEEKRRGCLNIA
jgi:hypothetical protein